MRLNAPARPRQDLHLRKVLLAEMHDAHRIFRIVTGDDDRLRGFGPGGAQQLKLGGVAIVNLIAIFSHQVDRADIALQHRNTHFVGHQQAANHLPETPEADDNHLRLIIFHVGHFGIFIRYVKVARQQPVNAFHHQRRGHHRERYRHQQQRHLVIVEKLLRRGAGEEHKRELPALAQHARERQPLGAPQPLKTPETVQHRHFDAHQHHHAHHDPQNMGIENAQIQRHADGDKKQPQQQPFERLDGDFQFVAIFALGQQNARDKRAERHRKPKQIHKQRGAQHQQQRGGGKHLAHAGTGNKPKHRAQEITPAHQHDGEREHFHANFQPVRVFITVAGQ
ncbi:hypothetical protein BN129_2900 [Cronobacter sakazakii 701]|nr:hypothetical protein BN129_2900 [Cronobacter sakazakii 701]